MSVTRAFVLALGRPIAPWGDAPGDALVVNKRLADAQRDSLAACGIRDVSAAASRSALPSDGAPYLVLSDDLFISRTLLRELIEKGSGGGDAVQLALSDSRVVRDSRPLQTLVDGPGWTGYPAWVVNRPGADLDSATPLVIDPREDVRTVPSVPRVFAESGEMKFALTSRVAIRLEHWVHVLRANHLAMLAGVAAMRERPWWQVAPAVLKILAKSFPPSEARVMRALVQRGRGVKIHPSAVVEASILGDGVQIAAQAVVKGSVLGPGATVGEGAFVEMSVLGERAHATKHVVSCFNVLYPGAVIGYGIHQMDVIGRDSFVSAEVQLLDFKFDGDVTVEHRGAIRSCGSKFLGCAVGHDVRIGAGVMIAHGRAIPNGTNIVRDPSLIVQKIVPAEDGGLLVVRDGLATPLKGRA